MFTALSRTIRRLLSYYSYPMQAKELCSPHFRAQFEDCRTITTVLCRQNSCSHRTFAHNSKIAARLQPFYAGRIPVLTALSRAIRRLPHDYNRSMQVEELFSPHFYAQFNEFSHLPNFLIRKTPFSALLRIIHCGDRGSPHFYAHSAEGMRGVPAER